jgi:hypothetical protein
LSFNYTSTLQSIYDIPLDRVLHIHGRAEDERVVLGHAWERSARLARLTDEDTDVRIAGGYEIIDGYFAETFKPTMRIIDEQRPFFASLSGIDEVFVLGHSLGEVDLPYYENIIDNIDDDRVTWTISFHTDPSRECAASESLGIPPHLVRYLPLAAL